jgi:hypothetical protein
MTWLRAYLSSLVAFREANHTDLVRRLDGLEKYAEPRRRFDAKGQAVSIAAPQPASTARLVSYDSWMAEHAPDHKRTA